MISGLQRSLLQWEQRFGEMVLCRIQRVNGGSGGPGIGEEAAAGGVGQRCS